MFNTFLGGVINLSLSGKPTNPKPDALKCYMIDKHMFKERDVYREEKIFLIFQTLQ